MRIFAMMRLAILAISVIDLIRHPNADTLVHCIFTWICLLLLWLTQPDDSNDKGLMIPAHAKR